jgi:thiamine-phosphate pyrophosphorylase
VATPRLYLIAPAVVTGAALREVAALVEGFDVACVRLAPATRDEAELRRAADGLREICHGAEVNLVIAEHFRLAGPLGLDGVHLGDGPRHVREARRVLGRDAIVGAHCGALRHDGMNAAESGADYVSFGPVRPSPLGDGSIAPTALFEWWAEMIEVPVVAEGGISPEAAVELAGSADFIALGEELWSHPEGARAALAAVVAAVVAAVAGRAEAVPPAR